MEEEEEEEEKEEGGGGGGGGFKRVNNARPSLFPTVPRPSTPPQSCDSSNPCSDSAAPDPSPGGVRGCAAATAAAATERERGGAR